MIHIVCVNAGNYCGAGRRYVETLHAMVSNSLPADFEYDFVCFTDDEVEYAEGIQVRPLPPGLEGWFNKLYLFKAGLFQAGDLILFLDLDTLIVGSLLPLLQYSGQFAILRDFLRPHGFGSGVMLWRADHATVLWEAYEAAGFPQIEGGDQSWIEQQRIGRIDYLQDLFPQRLVSFKVHCANGIPAGAAIICFHGHPRPHEVLTGWVPMVWRTGLNGAALGPPPEHFDGDIAAAAESQFWREEGQAHIIPQTSLLHPEGFSPGEYIRSFFIGCRRIAEVGCGVGRLAAAFEPDRYLGVDINTASLEVAQRNRPEHRFELLAEEGPLPECDGMLFYTVLLHINDTVVNTMLRRAARAARRIVIAEIMDRRWRRGGKPPVFNREAEEYVAHLNGYGYALVASERRAYERYNNEKWWAARDTRLTVLVFERSRKETAS